MMLLKKIMTRQAEKKLGKKYEELLICPITHGSLHYSAKTNELISDHARLAFPIKNGIPDMKKSAARTIPPHIKSYFSLKFVA